MNRAIVGAVLGVAALVAWPAPARAEDDAAKELKLVEGVWASTPAKKGRDRAHFIVFQGGRMGWQSFQTRDGELVIGHSKLFAIKLDGKASPKQITAKQLRANDPEERLGIYEIKGDELKVAFGHGAKRPKGLDDKDAEVIELKRDKEAKVPDLSKADQPEVRIEPTRKWLGTFADAKIAEQCPKAPIVKPADFEKVWKVLRGKEAVPKLDFAKGFVVIETSKYKLSGIEVVLEGDDSTDVMVGASSEKVDGHSYIIAAFRRDRIDVVDGKIVAKRKK